MVSTIVPSTTKPRTWTFAGITATHTRWLAAADRAVNLKPRPLSPGLWAVPSASNPNMTYIIDTRPGRDISCTCPGGFAGLLCKHLAAVARVAHRQNTGYTCPAPAVLAPPLSALAELAALESPVHVYA